jgi:hypothetical protein
VLLVVELVDVVDDVELVLLVVELVDVVDDVELVLLVDDVEAKLQVISCLSQNQCAS